MRRRSTRSAIEPPTSASAVTGSVCTSASAPTATGELRELEHEPVGSDLLHPRADERDAAAGEVEPVVAVPPEAAEGAVAERGERDGRPQP